MAGRGGAWDGGPELPTWARLVVRVVVAVLLAFAIWWLVIVVLTVVGNTRDVSDDEHGRRCLVCEPFD